jgi:hypothetical protein
MEHVGSVEVCSRYHPRLPGRLRPTYVRPELVHPEKARRHHGNSDVLTCEHEGLAPPQQARRKIFANRLFPGLAGRAVSMSWSTPPDWFRCCMTSYRPITEEAS